MKKRYFLAALLLTLTFLTCCAVALADNDVPPPEQISDDLNFSLVDWYLDVMPMADDLKITRATTGIYRLDSTHIGLRGVTQTNKICAHIKGYMVVQQWKNNQWNKYTSASYSVFGKAEGSGEFSISVESGYYYRLVMDHYALDYEGNNAFKGLTTEAVLF